MGIFTHYKHIGVYIEAKTRNEYTFNEILEILLLKHI